MVDSLFVMTELQTHLVTLVLDRLSDLGMTQSELAVDMGVTEKHLSQMLTGKSVGSIKMWDAVLRQLDLTL